MDWTLLFNLLKKKMCCNSLIILRVLIFIEKIVFLRLRCDKYCFSFDIAFLPKVHLFNRIFEYFMLIAIKTTKQSACIVLKQYHPLRENQMYYITEC